MKKIVEKLKQQQFLRAFIGFYDKSEIGMTSFSQYFTLFSSSNGCPLEFVERNTTRFALPHGG